MNISTGSVLVGVVLSLLLCSFVSLFRQATMYISLSSHPPSLPPLPRTFFPSPTRGNLSTKKAHDRP